MLEDNNLGKFKERRNKTVKPYERPKSILRRVTDSVTGLLPQPSWLVNWLHSSPKDNETESPVEEELSVPSTSSNTDKRNLIVENTNTESFIFQRPPGAFNQQAGRSSNTLSSDLIPETNHDDAGANLRDTSIQTNGDDDSHSESTSGCSSLLPHLDHRRDNRDVELPKVEPLNMDHSALQLLGNSLSKSLAVDLKNNRGRKTLSLQTFSQSTSIAASPTEDPRFIKDSESASISSFYGKSELSLNCSNNKRDLSLPQSSGFGSKRPRFNITSFGPITSDARKSLLNESIADSPFYAGRTTYGGASAYRRASLQPSTVAFPYNRKRVQARPSSSSISNASSSASGKTSSNVVLSSSANRILQALESMSTPVRDAKRIPTNVSSKRSTSFQDEDPSFSGFGLSRRRPNLGPPASKLTIGTPAQIVTRQPPVRTTAEISPVSSTPISAQAGGKMRSRKSAPPRQSAKEVARIREEEEEPIQVELQAQPFGLSSLPNFNLLPVPASTVPSASSAAMIQSTDKKREQFPTIVSSIVNGSLSSPKASATFTFSAPLVTVNPSSAAAATIVSATQNFNFSSPLSIEASMPKSTKQNSLCNIQAVSELKTGSVLDALKGNEPLLLQKSSTGDSSEKSVTSPALPVTSSMGLSEMFKPPTNSWKCSICMVINSEDKSTCLACDGPKSSVTSSSSSKTVDVNSTPISLPKQGFGDKFKKPTGQWECPVCCVFNSQDKEKCLSCEHQRPGSKITSATPSIHNFKFGIPKTSEKTEVSTTSIVRSTQEPATKPATGFQFGSTSTESSTATDSVKKAVPGFQFGPTLASTESSVATDSVKTVAGFQFGSTSTPSENSSVIDSVKKAGFQFGSTLGSASRENSTGFKLIISAEESKNAETSLPLDKATESTNDNGAIEINSGPLFKASNIPQGITSTETKQNVIPTILPYVEVNVASSSIGSTFGSGLFGVSTQSTSQPIGLKSTVTAAEPKLPFDFKSSSISSTATEDVKSASRDTKADETIITGKVPSFLLPVATTTTATSLAPTFSFQANNQNTFSFGQSNSEVVKEKTATSTPSLFGVSPVATPGSTGFDLASSLAKKDFNASSTATMNSFKSPALAFGLNSSVSSFEVSNISTSSSLPISAPLATGTTTGTANSNPVFSFGASSSERSSTSTSEMPNTSSFTSSQSAGQPFAFGQTSLSSFSTGKDVQKPSAGLFGFPAASTSSITLPTSPSSFGFASLSGVSTNPTSTSSTSAPPVFSFGTPMTATPTATSTAPKLVSNIPFSFGTQQSQMQSGSASNFGAFGSKASSTPFSFTGTPATGLTTPAFGEGATKPIASFGSSVAPSPFVTQSAGMFGAASGSFSASTVVSQSPAFTFGASSAPPPAQQSIFNPPPSYSFGSGPTAVAAPSQSISPQAPVFTFGNPSSSNPASSNFSFNAVNAPFSGSEAISSSSFASGLSNPFDNSGSGAGGGGPNRKIRKAVRRQR